MNEHPVATANANAREAWAEEIRQLAIVELRQAERRAAFTGRRLKTTN
jgi:hypothetical protein